MEPLNFEDVDEVFLIMINEHCVVLYLCRIDIFLEYSKHRIKYDVIIYLMIIFMFVLRSYFISYKNYFTDILYRKAYKRVKIFQMQQQKNHQKKEKIHWNE